MYALRDLRERDLLGSEGLLLSALLPLRRGRVREHVERGVEHHLGELRRDRVADRGEHAEARRDPHRAVHDRVDHEPGRLFGRERGHVLVDLRRRDHRRAHQRHVDVRRVDALVQELRGRALRERVERRLRRDVGGEARRARQHADRADVDDVTAALLGHLRQEREDQLHRAEVVELHRALEVVEAVERVQHRAPDRAPGVVDEEVDGAVVGEDLLCQRVDRSPCRRDRTSR